MWATLYTTKGVKHAGPGLSATLQIIRQMDGQVSATNVSGGGALFELLIPAFDGPLPTAELPADKSILLVDDADAWSRFVETTLRNAGNTVIRSANGQVDPAIFDLVLVDDALETADSVEVLERLKAAGAGDKTFVVATSLRVERTMALMPLGVRDVLLKPYTLSALAEIVRS